MKYATKKAADEIISREKEEKGTAYFDGELTFSQMRETFHWAGFGPAETNFILAAMVKAGAKFRI